MDEKKSSKVRQSFCSADCLFSLFFCCCMKLNMFLSCLLFYIDFGGVEPLDSLRNIAVSIIRSESLICIL